VSTDVRIVPKRIVFSYDSNTAVPQRLTWNRSGTVIDDGISQWESADLRKTQWSSINDFG
jgi:hypothetical protein